MGSPGTRDTARTRRRYFTIAVAGGLGATLALAVMISPRSSAAPPAEHPAARTAVAQRPAAAAPAPAAKASAQAALAANPAADAAPPQTLVSQAAKSAATRLVQYDGYQVTVPGSWPVYDLAADPSRCVLFNTHAVYLGTPGSAQACPAAALGHTESLLIQPASQASAPASAVVLAAGTAALAQQAALPAVAAAAAATSHEIQVEVPGAGVLVTAAYGTDEAQIRAILAGATLTGAAASSGASSGASTTAAVRGAPATQGLMATGAQAITAQAGKQTAQAGQQAAKSAAASQLTGITATGLGFDTCTVPSASVMAAWLSSPYRLVATYLGGMNWACSYGNFTASWVSKVAAEGWRFMPLWVGPQAPCTDAPYVAKINPAQAAAEGQAEAGSAVAAARTFGYGQGTPIYFDMEGYSTPDASCSQAVLNFLGGWTRALHAAGYVSGVYSSASSGIKDLAGQYRNSGYPRPDDIWIADWNGEPVLTDSAVPNGDWADNQRLHQYAGPHGETWGGGTLDIDSDVADGLVAGLPTAPVLHGPDESAAPSELTVAPGQTATVQLTLRGVPDTPTSVQWQIAAPAGLTVTPDEGTVDLWPGMVLSVPLALTPSTSLAAGRYDLPITVTAGSQPVAKTFVLVSVVAAGGALATPHPLTLYAADQASMSAAVAIARALALPSADVTGSFSRAWTDVAGGKDLVLAVGQPAANALFFNVCGWANPAKMRAGSTPFYYVGEPQRQSPGRNYFELSDLSTTAGTTQLTTQLTQYALAGTLPDYGSGPAAPSPPALTCLGSPNVSVP